MLRADFAKVLNKAGVLQRWLFSPLLLVQIQGGGLEEGLAKLQHKVLPDGGGKFMCSLKHKPSETTQDSKCLEIYAKGLVSQE